eukprot:TRINITY_DN4289_c0_g1_i1.p1 TRINITY_DN4289_c0_g1~~TRINITY_DN4289_c0_g1_i1.p1  ORF type:complete len:589 (+),score=122.39 TRINITY_DN4289_c0_g1_i1:87-1853(+)
MPQPKPAPKSKRSAALRSAAGRKRAAPTSAALPESLPAGAVVEAHSLRDLTMNGVRGEVLRAHNDGRVVVATPVGKCALHPKNLRPVDDTVDSVDSVDAEATPTALCSAAGQTPDEAEEDLQFAGAGGTNEEPQPANGGAEEPTGGEGIQYGSWERRVSSSAAPGTFYWYNWETQESVWEDCDGPPEAVRLLMADGGQAASPELGQVPSDGADPGPAEHHTPPVTAEADSPQQPQSQPPAGDPAPSAADKPKPRAQPDPRAVAELKALKQRLRELEAQKQALEKGQSRPAGGSAQRAPAAPSGAPPAAVPAPQPPPSGAPVRRVVVSSGEAPQRKRQRGRTASPPEPGKTAAAQGAEDGNDVLSICKQLAAAADAAQAAACQAEAGSSAKRRRDAPASGPAAAQSEAQQQRPAWEVRARLDAALEDARRRREERAARAAAAASPGTGRAEHWVVDDVLTTAGPPFAAAASAAPWADCPAVESGYIFPEGTTAADWPGVVESAAVPPPLQYGAMPPAVACMPNAAAFAGIAQQMSLQQQLMMLAAQSQPVQPAAGAPAPGGCLTAPLIGAPSTTAVGRQPRTRRALEAD